jgi:hypothetical protein
MGYLVCALASEKIELVCIFRFELNSFSFQLQLGKQDFPAHRVVLAAASPYFMELFTSEEDQPSR